MIFEYIAFGAALVGSFLFGLVVGRTDIGQWCSGWNSAIKFCEKNGWKRPMELNDLEDEEYE